MRQCVCIWFCAWVCPPFIYKLCARECFTSFSFVYLYQILFSWVCLPLDLYTCMCVCPLLHLCILFIYPFMCVHVAITTILTVKSAANRKTKISDWFYINYIAVKCCIEILLIVIIFVVFMVFVITLVPVLTGLYIGWCIEVLIHIKCA